MSALSRKLALVLSHVAFYLFWHTSAFGPTTRAYPIPSFFPISSIASSRALAESSSTRTFISEATDAFTSTTIISDPSVSSATLPRSASKIWLYASSTSSAKIYDTTVSTVSNTFQLLQLQSATSSSIARSSSTQYSFITSSALPTTHSAQIHTSYSTQAINSSSSSHGLKPATSTATDAQTMTQVELSMPSMVALVVGSSVGSAILVCLIVLCFIMKYRRGSYNKVSHGDDSLPTNADDSTGLHPLSRFSTFAIRPWNLSREGRNTNRNSGYHPIVESGTRESDAALVTMKPSSFEFPAANSSPVITLHAAGAYPWDTVPPPREVDSGVILTSTPTVLPPAYNDLYTPPSTISQHRVKEAL